MNTIGSLNREHSPGPCARMTCKFVKRSKFLTISFAEYQKVLHAQPLVISITSAYVSGLCKRGPLHDRKTRSVTKLARKQKQHKQIIIVRLIEGKKGNNLGTRQEPLRIQVNNNCLKYCDSFHLWPEALWLAERVSYLAFFWRPQRDSRKLRLNGHVKVRFFLL